MFRLFAIALTNCSPGNSRLIEEKTTLLWSLMHSLSGNHFSSFSSSGRQDLSAVLRRHSGAESVNSGMRDLLRLKRHLAHFNTSTSACYQICLVIIRRSYHNCQQSFCLGQLWNDRRKWLKKSDSLHKLIHTLWISCGYFCCFCVFLFQNSIIKHALQSYIIIHIEMLPHFLW